ncbi:hypothetical protein EHO60_02060 [Leptospira fletcheri]|uniref:Uncharacterized protein n=1 Tax=Leptospira fletcheri TaxID=2484981 RepID=A0A4R9GIR4_9LEPT|nr:hypothetical protein [Leptospira fletcheri]TGK13009.1 hypothetical protein EHO60_02060 [Leptospira fletcheri]
MAQNLTLISLLTGGSGCATLQPTSTVRRMAFGYFNETIGTDQGIHTENKMLINNLELGRGVVMISTSTDLSKYSSFFYKNYDPCSQVDTYQSSPSPDIALHQHSPNISVPGPISGSGNYLVITESNQATTAAPSDVMVSLSSANPCKSPVIVTTSSQPVSFYQIGSNSLLFLYISNITISQSVNIYSTTTSLVPFANFQYLSGTNACFPDSFNTGAFSINGASTFYHVILNPSTNGSYYIFLNGINLATPSDITVKIQ